MKLFLGAWFFLTGLAGVTWAVEIVATNENPRYFVVTWLIIASWSIMIGLWGYCEGDSS